MMGPSIDVYVFSQRRDEAMLRRFVQRYADVAASEDRGDEELAMLPLGAIDDAAGDEVKWESALTLTHILAREWITRDGDLRFI